MNNALTLLGFAAGFAATGPIYKYINAMPANPDGFIHSLTHWLGWHSGIIIRTYNVAVRGEQFQYEQDGQSPAKQYKETITHVNNAQCHWCTTCLRASPIDGVSPVFHGWSVGDVHLRQHLTPHDARNLLSRFVFDNTFHMPRNHDEYLLCLNDPSHNIRVDALMKRYGYCESKPL